MRILIFGDSITQGFYDEKRGGWCNQLVAYSIGKSAINLNSKDIIITNRGISGDNTEDLLKRLESECISHLVKYPGDNDISILAIGMNDSIFEMSNKVNQVSLANFRSNLQDIHRILCKFVSKVIITSVPPVVDRLVQPMPWKTTHGYSNEQIDTYNQILIEFSKQNDLLFIEMNNVFGDETETCLRDGLHPNVKGHKLIFERIKNVLEKENLL